MVNESVKKAIESLYEGKCSVYGYGIIVNDKTHLKSNKEYLIYENIPCRLSVKSVSSANDGNVASGIVQDVKLFLSHDYQIKAGCKIIVTQNGVTTEYKNSGQPNIKSNHQEISLELFKEWA